MECKLRISIAFTIAAISLFYFAIEHRRRRNRRKFSKKSCYLSFEYKPQSTFKRVLADNSYSPFKHLKLSNCSDEILSNLHPYEEEIMALLKNPRINSRIFDGISMLGMSKSHIWVESVSQLRELVDVLSEEKIFAVDTEQHSLRSFLGFTALLQISTLKEDYLVDTIALHDTIHMLQFVFSDPNIVKVFHGADNDVLWLQRDFHIYVVNLFDTAKACEVLSKPQKSLAYLLETYCGVATNKLLQREDWRQRPLPDDMVEYARLDAHYLLYITKCLIKELEAEDNDVSQPTEFAPQEDRLHFLLEASRRSNAASLQLFSKVSDVFPGESVASSMISRYLNNQRVASPKNFGAQFQNHIRTLCAWRDIMARVHDESLRFVLSDQAIIALAEKRPISEREVYTIISIADEDNDPLSSSFGISPSPLICSHWEDVCCLLKEEQSSSLDDNLHMLLLNHLGPNGSCPLSTYNYNILSGSNLKLANGSICMQNSVRSGKLVMHKASRKELFVKKFSCKAPVYHNCRIYASDGRLLCYCDRKKLEWYLGRNLAELVDDNPPAIMLLFEPKGRPEAEGNDFYAQSKKNMCVSCGESNHYLRYRIIPSCYRMHFPEHLKSHRSHDIVLLCVDCHEVAHAAAEKHKRQVAAEFGIPLYVKKVADSRELQLTETSEVHGHQEAGVSPLQLRTAAMALLRHGSRMPSKRHEELIEIVKTYYGGRAISHEDLEAALLVGMSPNGRRKFKKKRMATYQQASTGSDNIPGNNSFSMLETINHCSSETSRPSGSPNVKYQASSFDQLANEPVTDIKTPLSASVNDIREDAFAIDGVRVPRMLAARGISDAQDVTLLNTGNICDRNPSEATTSSGLPNFDGKKCNSKVSLLGHGPHGKEVVDYLLKNYGEDGVHSFCQRWREVFVDALHPRHLPAGWDVKHSGKRAFGEFSVYNPLKKG